MHAIDPGPLSNKLLAALPREDFKLLSPHLTTHGIEQGTVLCEPDDEIDQIYFPLSGMVSLVMVMKDGKAIETATVGREGVVGAMAGLGLHRTRVRALAQLPLFAGQNFGFAVEKGGKRQQGHRRSLHQIQRSAPRSGESHRGLQRSTCS